VPVLNTPPESFDRGSLQNVFQVSFLSHAATLSYRLSRSARRAHPVDPKSPGRAPQSVPLPCARWYRNASHEVRQPTRALTQNFTPFLGLPRASQRRLCTAAITENERGFDVTANCSRLSRNFRAALLRGPSPLASHSSGPSIQLLAPPRISVPALTSERVG
jgi:hypothetical protein